VKDIIRRRCFVSSRTGLQKLLRDYECARENPNASMKEDLFRYHD